MKIIFCSFEIAKWGGIIEYMASCLKAFKELGHEVDIVNMTAASTTENVYRKKVKEFETGAHQDKIKFHSQQGGYQLDETVPYWRNNYYGYYLPPSNRIGVYEENAVERFYNIVNDADIIIWNFMPTKSSAWNRKDMKFDFWWKFFDLPSRIKQVYLVHDGYFDVRASNVSAFKDKILFLGCTHLAAYRCSENIGIPRIFLSSSRNFGEKMFYRKMQNRTQDFFAAHMFKSMKHMEEFIAAIPYIQKAGEERCAIRVAGTGIEYNYMTSETKTKAVYMCNRKRDPNLPKKLDGKISLWNRALKWGMEYMGQMSGEDVLKTLRNTKFAVDPSWCEHYSTYCRTNINGFIIEAILSGAYPVLRDYRGLNEVSKTITDPIFDELRAIVVPWDATPKEYGDAMRKAMEMSPQQFYEDTLWNFQLAQNLFDAKTWCQDVIRLCKGGRKLIKKELECGKDSENVKRITSELMEDFYGIQLPLKWEN